MIDFVLVVNQTCKVRLAKFYKPWDETTQQQMIREAFSQVSKRSDSLCNFVEGSTVLVGKDTRLIYRHYATLYFIFAVDSSESELGILDLIQVFVETLDRCFENVCELDLVFNVEKVYAVLDEIITGGLVLETNSHEIITALDEQKLLEKQAVAPSVRVGPIKPF